MIYETENFQNIRNKLFLNDSISFSNTPNTQNNELLFPIHKNEEEMQVKSKNIDLNGIHKSASITFYSKKRGYLLCMEFRDNKLVYHPIGGKYEDKDENIEKTACREFIEESGILNNNEFINLINNETLIENSNETLIENSINYIHNILKDKSTYYDYYVNKDKMYIHRYYVINIDTLDFKIKNIIETLDIFYENTFKEIKNNDEYIVSLNWNKELNKNNLNKKNYSMLTIYLSNLLKNKK